MRMPLAGVPVYSGRGKGDYPDAVAEPVSGSTLAALGLTHPVQRLRLLQYQDLLKEAS